MTQRSIEQLTDEERALFAVLPEHLGGINMRKALRIIDAHAAAVTALEVQLERVTGYLDTERKCHEHREADIERLEEALETARAQVSELTAELAEQIAIVSATNLALCEEVNRLRAEGQRFRLLRDHWKEQRDLERADLEDSVAQKQAAESECAALRAEVDNERRRANYHQGAADNLRKEVERHKRGRAENGEAADAYRDRANAAESRLAAANALLGDCARGNRAIWPHEARAHLAAQPATAPDRTEHLAFAPLTSAGVAAEINAACEHEASRQCTQRARKSDDQGPTQRRNEP